MIKGRTALVALLIAAALGYGAFRLFFHSSAPPTPAVLTPKSDVHKALGRDLPSRISRMLKEPGEVNRAGRRRLIALTFDDGPYPIATPLLLDVLNRLRVKATFFYIGRDAEQWPELTKRTWTDGHEIADHTYSHPNLDQLSDSGVAMEIRKGAKVLHRFSSDSGIDTLFRPPHGRFTEDTIAVAQRLHYHTILWSDDPGDWRTMTAKALAAHIEAHATAPEIVLLHSGRMATIAMLPDVVARFRAAGYEFVTVSELLAREPAEHANHPAKHPV
ncbi:MAG: hypothetical protein NVS9B12_15590 [Vulcanimicrobiaceae bacterium]